MTCTPWLEISCSNLLPLLPLCLSLSLWRMGCLAARRRIAVAHARDARERDTHAHSDVTASITDLDRHRIMHSVISWPLLCRRRGPLWLQSCPRLNEDLFGCRKRCMTGGHERLTKLEPSGHSVRSLFILINGPASAAQDLCSSLKNNLTIEMTTVLFDSQQLGINQCKHGAKSNFRTFL